MNIAQVLKAEIARISKKEAKALNAPTKATSIQLKRTVASLKIRLTVLERANSQLQKQVAELAASQPIPREESEVRGWISGKGVKSLRKRLNITQGELAKLLDVSTGAVCQWEAKQGVLKLRTATRKAIMAIRSIGAKEAKRRLNEKAR